MSVDLEKKVVFVTGSARRVGRVIALAFAEQGANLVIHHVSPSSAEPARTAVEEAKAMGVDAVIITGDQGNPDHVERMMMEIRGYYGRLDVLVNSAGLFRRADFLEIDLKDWQRVMDVNLTGPFLLTQSAARLMIETEREGVIINIGDNGGLNGWVSYPHHSISKAGVVMLTRVSALALAEHHIRVNCVVPGPVLAPPGEEETFERLVKSLPLGHAGDPEHVGQACVFLAQNEFATGTVMRVDGGEGAAGAEL
jgi:NAD(P)-dependent dehydrogenase (short-subunit alcohol dehydrogenase family)